MSSVVELVQRTERLQQQAELLRRELSELRSELLQLSADSNGSQTTPAANKDCFTVAAALALDLGPEFSSERPHDLTDRGADWFSEP